MRQLTADIYIRPKPRAEWTLVAVKIGTRAEILKSMDWFLHGLVDDEGLPRAQVKAILESGRELKRRKTKDGV